MLMGRDPTCPCNGFGRRAVRAVEDRRAPLVARARALPAAPRQLLGSVLVALTIVVVVIVVVVAAIGHGTGANPNDDSGGGGGKGGKVEHSDGGG
jgi:hypothetical protein